MKVVWPSFFKCLTFCNLLINNGKINQGLSTNLTGLQTFGLERSSQTISLPLFNFIPNLTRSSDYTLWAVWPRNQISIACKCARGRIKRRLSSLGDNLAQSDYEFKMKLQAVIKSFSCTNLFLASSLLSWCYMWKRFGWQAGLSLQWGMRPHIPQPWRYPQGFIAILSTVGKLPPWAAFGFLFLGTAVSAVSVWTHIHGPGKRISLQGWSSVPLTRVSSSWHI